nr:hypothetical protein [Microbispora sp. H11081]
MRRHGDLGVPHPLGGQVAAHAVRQCPQVLGRPHQVDHLHIDLEEMGEVAELVEGLDQRGVGGHGRRPLVPRGEVGDDAR